MGRVLLLSWSGLLGSARPLNKASRAEGEGREKMLERDWEALACLPKSAFITPAQWQETGRCVFVCGNSRASEWKKHTPHFVGQCFHMPSLWQVSSTLAGWVCEERSIIQKNKHSTEWSSPIRLTCWNLERLCLTLSVEVKITVVLVSLSAITCNSGLRTK